MVIYYGSTKTSSWYVESHYKGSFRTPQRPTQSIAAPKTSISMTSYRLLLESIRTINLPNGSRNLNIKSKTKRPNPLNLEMSLTRQTDWIRLTKSSSSYMPAIHLGRSPVAGRFWHKGFTKGQRIYKGFTKESQRTHERIHKRTHNRTHKRTHKQDSQKDSQKDSQRTHKRQHRTTGQPAWLWKKQK